MPLPATAGQQAVSDAPHAAQLSLDLDLKQTMGKHSSNAVRQSAAMYYTLVYEAGAGGLGCLPLGDALHHPRASAQRRLQHPLCSIAIPLLGLVFDARSASSSSLCSTSSQASWHGISRPTLSRRACPWPCPSLAPKASLSSSSQGTFSSSPLLQRRCCAVQRPALGFGAASHAASLRVGQLWPLAHNCALRCQQHLLSGHLQRRADGAARPGQPLLGQRHRLLSPSRRDAGIDCGSAALAPSAPASPRDARHHGVPRARNLRPGLTRAAQPTGAHHQQPLLTGTHRCTSMLCLASGSSASRTHQCETVKLRTWWRRCRCWSG